MSTAEPLSTAVATTAAAESPAVEQASRATRLLRSPHAVRFALAFVILLSGGVTIAAMRHTSPTFDEITTMSAGALGWKTGRFDLMTNYPPVTQYIYGLPVYLTHPAYPVDERVDLPGYRYKYAQDFLYKVGNDPERIAFVARLAAAAIAMLLIWLTFAYTRSSFGVGAGLLAASLVAFLPDVLAHGGIAYNDIALAPAFLAAVWAMDAALRRPSLWRGAAAGALVSIAVGVKHSALVLGPIAVVLVLVELLACRFEQLPRHALRITLTVLTATLVGYLVQVALYGGDFTLAYLLESTHQAEQHISGGHGIPVFLLGRLLSEAPWYYYPVAFAYKTSIGLHLLILLAVAGAVLAARGASWRSVLTSPARAPIIALVAFCAVLFRANLAIGFRYALPILPIVCMLTAAGAVQFWRRTTPLLRGSIVLLTLWSAVSALVYYPHFLPYTSEYKSDPDTGYMVFVDSSFDWGQSLLELRAFMRKEHVDRVYLSYFGSALPEGYGIDYVPLPSFFPLPRKPTPAEEPRYVAVSATNLVGLYLNPQLFAPLRKQPPYKVLGHTMFIYKVRP